MALQEEIAYLKAKLAAMSEAGVTTPAGAGSGAGMETDVRSPANLLAKAKENPDATSVVLANGRVVPMSLIIDGGDMVSVSHPPVMRLILKNQSGVNKCFAAYADDEEGETVSRENFERFCYDLDIV